MDLVHELLHLTVGSLSLVKKDTVLELLVVLDVLVVSNLLGELLAELMLVSEHFSYFLLVNWHSALVSEVHGPLLMQVSVLGSKSLVLRDLGKFLC